MYRYLPIVLLVISNMFMTYAWYGHLKDAKSAPIWIAVLLSWGVAFFEYCFMVPANRIGQQVGYSFAELKTIQEIVTLVVFSGFAIFYFKERLAWNHLLGFCFIILAGLCIFGFNRPVATTVTETSSENSQPEITIDYQNTHDNSSQPTEKQYD